MHNLLREKIIPVGMLVLAIFIPAFGIGVSVVPSEPFCEAVAHAC